MAELDSLFKCTLGSSNFQLEDYSFKSEPVVKQDKGLVGRNITVNGEGWVQADDAGAFAAALQTTALAFEVSGQNFIITGLGGNVEVLIAAARCFDGGPHCGFEMLGQLSEEPLRKKFKFTLSASTVPGDPEDPEDADSYSMSITTGPDGRRVIARKGNVTGPEALQTYLNITLPSMREAYPWPYWVLNSQYEQSQSDQALKLSYTITVSENAGALFGDGLAMGVEGEMTTRVERDEAMRLVRTIAHDYLVTGDPYHLLTIIRPTTGTILRESFEITSVAEIRLRASFTIIEGIAGSPLLDWQENISFEDNTAETVEGFEYVGTPPILVKGAQKLCRITHSGRAVGCGVYIRARAPFEGLALEAPPRVLYDLVNHIEHETRWEYRYLVTDSEELLEELLRSMHRPSDAEVEVILT
jgi:hypothetical protein